MRGRHGVGLLPRLSSLALGPPLLMARRTEDLQRDSPTIGNSSIFRGGASRRFFATKAATVFAVVVFFGWRYGCGWHIPVVER